MELQTLASQNQRHDFVAFHFAIRQSKKEKEIKKF